ncbi:MAG TPA: 30s ribosomal protein S12 methylthiotransferase accessory protein YcaO, partial [Gammaproteobacteria bacterium]|nr:30s ribosomal protein S12 methylthiotransferase accessory protein YcaO [Gammaproteobacteria bacterium]
NFTGSTSEEYDWLCTLLHEEGFEIYCQDYDHLGVNACRILVPGFSEIYPVEDLLWENNNSAVALRHDILNIAGLSREQRNDLAQALDEQGHDPQQPVAALIGLAPDRGTGWETLRIGELEALLALSLKQYEKATDHLDWVIQYGQLNPERLGRYRCLLNLLNIMVDDEKEISAYRAALQHLHGIETVSDCEAMLRGKQIFDHLPFPGNNMENTRTHRQLINALRLARS